MRENEKVLLIKELKEIQEKVSSIRWKYELEPYIALGLIGIKWDLERVISNLEPQDEEVEIEIEVEC